MATRASADQRPERPRRGGNLPIGLVLGSGSLLHQVGRELGTALERQLAPYGITAQQAALLLHAGQQDTGPSQLMAALGTDTAGMTKLLDRLEGKGLLQRRKHPHDRRAVIIELTDQGRPASWLNWIEAAVAAQGAGCLPSQKSRRSQV